MALRRCDEGHYYEPLQHSSCPHCGIPDLRVQPTVARRPDAGADPGGPAPTRAAGHVGRGGDDGKTVGVFQKQLGVDPVVGWLVCIQGPDRGRDYRIRAGRNFIGRDESMHIAIRNDAGVSREKHAILSFEPRRAQFKLLPGDSAGLTYVNDQTVDVPVELAAFDNIELGATKLLFVPFCGERFQWTSDSDAQG
jgi:hypothetical protein